MSQDHTIVLPGNQPGAFIGGTVMGQPGVGKTTAISYYQKLGMPNRPCSSTIEEARKIPGPANTPDRDPQK